MKKIFCLAIFSCIFMLLNAQKAINVDSTEVDMRSLFTATQGQPFMTAKFVKITSGSPYYVDDWNDGEVTLRDGTRYKKVSMRVNLLDEQLHILNSGKEMVLDRNLKEVRFKNSASGDTIVFRRGYPQVESSSQSTFFQVLSDGKVSLLKYMKKKLMDNLMYGSATQEQTIQNSYSYYIHKENSMNKLKLDKDNLVDALSDKQQAVKDYISQNNLKCRSEKDVVQVINHYNTLH